MLIFSVFKTLTDQQVTVELKNDLSITGVLKSVDQFLNIRLDNIKVADENRHPHMMAVKNCFIRGSVVRYVQLPPEHVDTQLLEDATRREQKTVDVDLSLYFFIARMYIIFTSRQMIYLHKQLSNLYGQVDASEVGFLDE
ncbi:U6 snRNA-associated Sm-like protein LSm2 [Psilocybe cubensis]|uniref:U6 snRNA-associated Sm-like protein LSm2 n=2 Tax=Psilocybe cubensis TaxID=181762 RepID=A0ACB8HB01_PSICU|nr:U6 snRNA-associated Sm-like protein LSm2 [Psilocybe cubensis]KAH9485026.1 U6 snRNA-associated Sm-like protein LSm2 [Psilocybe cubensis]